MIRQFLAVNMMLSLPFASSAFGSTRVMSSMMFKNNEVPSISCGDGLCMQTSSHNSSSSSSKQRRAIINDSSRAILSSLLVWNLSLPTKSFAEEVSYQRITSIPKIAQYIIEECNSDFLSSVVKSNYNFLYRGLSPEQSKEATNGSSDFAAIVLRDESFDLLDSNTYNSKEAATYFQSLEDEMTTKGMVMKPSNSHMGTTCPIEASKWGQAASIWPLGGEGVEFAWLADGGTFWPIDKGTSTKKNRRLATTSTAKHGLADALQGDAWDIMFRADNGLLAVPADLDSELRAKLREMQ